jgi:multidrug efflux pump subunit AcrA (membrane-fusion protein)
MAKTNMTETMERDEIMRLISGENEAAAPTAEPINESPSVDEAPTVNEESQPGEPSPEIKTEEVDRSDKTESRYEKLRKAEARQNKTWQKLQEEKEQIRKLKDDLEASRKQLEEDRSRIAEEIVNKGDEASPDVYEAVAERFRDSGEPELAEEAARMAEEARRKRANASQTVEINRFKKEWADSVSELVKAKPELNDQESELYKATEFLLKNKPALTTYSSGFRDAVEVAEYYVNSKRAESVEDENKRLRAELESYKRKLNLGTSDVPRRSGPKGFDDMSRDEQREAILRMTRANR